MNREERRSGKKQRYFMANLVYQSAVCGGLYVNLWLENQLKTLLDPTNLPALRERYDLEYLILCDEESLPGITRHPNFMALGQIADCNILRMDWGPNADRFGARYGMLVQMMHAALNQALTKDAWLSCWVADLVFAKHALPRILKPLERGYDATYNVPIRSAADSMNQHLQKIPFAPSDTELFALAYQHLHPLWTHSTWNNPYFTRMPYSMLWNSRQGLLAHNFGITPIAFKPNEAMKQVTGGIDSDLPKFIKNPYWATDWIDAPVAGVEPLSNGHYPPFHNESSSIERVAAWATHGADGRPCVHPCQADNLSHPLYFPSKKVFANPDLITQASELMEGLERLVRLW